MMNQGIYSLWWLYAQLRARESTHSDFIRFSLKSIIGGIDEPRALPQWLHSLLADWPQYALFLFLFSPELLADGEGLIYSPSSQYCRSVQGG